MYVLTLLFSLTGLACRWCPQGGTTIDSDRTYLSLNMCVWCRREEVLRILATVTVDSCKTYPISSISLGEEENVWPQVP